MNGFALFIDSAIMTALGILAVVGVLIVVFGTFTARTTRRMRNRAR